MCSAYSSGSRPWLFCPIDDIRIAYIDFEQALSKHDPTAASEIWTRMRNFTYNTTDSFIRDVSDVLGTTVSGCRVSPSPLASSFAQRATCSTARGRLTCASMSGLYHALRLSLPRRVRATARSPSYNRGSHREPRQAK